MENINCRIPILEMLSSLSVDLHVKESAWMEARVKPLESVFVYRIIEGTSAKRNLLAIMSFHPYRTLLTENCKLVLGILYYIFFISQQVVHNLFFFFFFLDLKMNFFFLVHLGTNSQGTRSPLALNVIKEYGMWKDIQLQM